MNNKYPYRKTEMYIHYYIDATMELSYKCIILLQTIDK